MFLGLEADKYFNTNPLFLIIGLIVGLVVSIYETYHLLIPIIKTEEKE